MKNKNILFIILGVIMVLLIGSSIYIDFIAKSSKGFTYLFIIQMLLGISALISTLFIGIKAFPNKKNYELLFIGFLEGVLVLGIVLLDYVYGYANVIDSNNYIEYMRYISMETNIIIYILFVCIIGLLSLNLYIKEKIAEIKPKIKENAQEAE